MQADRLRNSMVAKQIEARSIRDEKVLNAMLKVPRHRFIPDVKDAIAYSDHPQPIGFNQTISQPYIVAFMTEALRLDGTERILEIGTGCGYQTAVLAEIASHVHTIEVIAELSRRAEQTLTTLGYSNISFRVGNGREGWPGLTFDGIMVTAAPAELPDVLIEQLKPRGRLILPVGEASQNLVRYTKTESGYAEETMIAVRFVPLV
ncbi:MAG: protein-L-isoaspartate(D-aspartate) O-methyltransferase [Planctomycetota bacterium]